MASPLPLRPQFGGLEAGRGVVRDDEPVIPGSHEDIGSQDAKALGLTFNDAGDAFDAGYETAIAFHGDIDVVDVEVHQSGAVENPLPGAAYIAPAYDGLPAGVNAQGAVGLLPNGVHLSQIQRAEGVIETLVGVSEGEYVGVFGKHDVIYVRFEIATSLRSSQ